MVLYREKYVWLDADGREDIHEMQRFEYQVKWKGFSHLHCEWVPEGELLQVHTTQSASRMYIL